jgi:N-acetylmuramoyl-L-alanine amidase
LTRTTGTPLLVLLCFLLLPAALPGQVQREWRLESGGQGSTVREATARGYPALPISALASVGAEISYGRGEATARWGAATVRFRADSREVEAPGGTVYLRDAVFSAGGMLYVPTEFFVEYLQEASGRAVSVDPLARLARGQAVAVPAAPPAAAAPPPPPPPVVATPVPARPGMRSLVVIDAGHGGVDPGARGQNGTREKDLTLAVARRLYQILRDDPTLDVRMTRDRDTLIALRDRARFANGWRRDGQPALFMSIHANAHPSRAAKGFETFFLSEARTEDARRVEAMENAAMQYEEGPRDRTPIDFIMQDLRQNQYLRESSDWAQLIQNRLREVHPGPDRGVKQAGFAVLNGAFMPAVLVELGFISNADEERLMLDTRQQDLFAQQLAASVRDFFRIQRLPAITD